MFRKFGFPLIGFTLAAVLLYTFRLPIFLRLWPGLPLRSAVLEAADGFRSRFADDPLEIIRSCLDFEDNTRILCDLQHHDPILGTSRWDMDITLQNMPPALTAAGTVSLPHAEFPLALYLDEDCGAFRLFQGQDTVWYGIHFDSFAKSLQDAPLLRSFLEDYPQSLFLWLESEDKIPSLPRISIPEFSFEFLDRAISALAVLPWDVQLAEDPGTGSSQSVYHLQTQISTQKLSRFLSDLPLGNHLQADPSGIITADFTLCQDRLLGFSLTTVTETQSISLLGQFEKGIRDGPISFQLLQQDREGDRLFSLTIFDQEGRWESGIITLPSGETWNWRWNTESSNLEFAEVLHSGAKGICADFHGPSQTIHIRTPNPSLLIEAITGREVVHPERFGLSSFTILPGKTFRAPAFRDFSRWTAEELLRILDFLHSLSKSFQE